MIRIEHVLIDMLTCVSVLHGCKYWVSQTHPRVNQHNRDKQLKFKVPVENKVKLTYISLIRDDGCKLLK